MVVRFIERNMSEDVAGLKPIAVLDTQLISNLSHPQHQQRIEAGIAGLRSEGFVVGVTETVISELAGTKNEAKWHAHFEMLREKLDLVINIARGDMLIMEIAGEDCQEWVTRKLYAAKGFPDVSEARGHPALDAYLASDREWKKRMRLAGPSVESENPNVTPADVMPFPEFLPMHEIDHAKAFLAGMRCQTSVQDISSEFAQAVLDRGRAFRAAVVFGLANQYDIIERKARGLRTSPGGSLSDSAIVSEGAYFALLLTMDEDFARAGKYFNQVIDTPKIRYFDANAQPSSRSGAV
jgi:hypothetical protein